MAKKQGSAKTHHGLNGSVTARTVKKEELKICEVCKNSYKTYFNKECPNCLHSTIREEQRVTKTALDAKKRYEKEHANDREPFVKERKGKARHGAENGNKSNTSGNSDSGASTRGVIAA